MFEAMDFSCVPRQWQQRELWYQQILNAWDQHASVLHQANQMIKDDQQQPIVGSLLDQLVGVIGQPHLSWPMVLRRRFIHPETIDRAKNMIWMRAYLRHIDEVLSMLIGLHHRRTIFLNRQDLHYIGQIHAAICAAALSNWFDFCVVEGFLYATHVDVVPSVASC